MKKPNQGQTLCGDVDHNHPSYPKWELPTLEAYRGLKTN